MQSKVHVYGSGLIPRRHFEESVMGIRPSPPLRSTFAIVSTAEDLVRVALAFKEAGLIKHTTYKQALHRQGDAFYLPLDAKAAESGAMNSFWDRVSSRPGEIAQGRVRVITAQEWESALGQEFAGVALLSARACSFKQPENFPPGTLLSETLIVDTDPYDSLSAASRLLREQKIETLQPVLVSA